MAAVARSWRSATQAAKAPLFRQDPTMDRERIPGTATGIDEPRAGPRRTQAEAARGRGRPRGGIKTISIDGEWHTRGRIFLDGIAGPIGRLRESTGLPDTPENFAAAEGIGRQKAE